MTYGAPRCCACRDELSVAEQSREGRERLEHGAAYCTACRTCEWCGTPSLTDAHLGGPVRERVCGCAEEAA